MKFFLTAVGFSLVASFSSAFSSPDEIRVSCYVLKADKFVDVYKSNVNYKIGALLGHTRSKFAATGEVPENSLIKFQHGEGSHEISVTLHEKRQAQEFSHLPYLGTVVVRGEVFENVSCAATVDY